MVGLILVDLKNSLLCPLSILMTFGENFLLPMDENGERKCATISDHVHTLDHTQTSGEDQLSFKLKVDGEQLDHLIFYKQLMEYLEDTLDTGQTEDRLYKFKSIQDHRGPYSPSDPEYLGRSNNLLIEWETEEMTWNPSPTSSR